MKKKNGFTLMEVLVAMAVLGIGLGVILELFSGGLKSAKVSEEFTLATWYGKTKMEEMLSTKNLTEGVTEDTFDSQFSWKTDVAKANPSLGVEGTEGTQGTQGPKVPVDLYKIVVTVSWPSGKGQRSLEMESLRVFKTEEASQ